MSSTDAAVVGYFGPDHGAARALFDAQALKDDNRLYSAAAADKVSELAAANGVAAPAAVLLRGFLPRTAVLAFDNELDDKKLTNFIETESLPLVCAILPRRQFATTSTRGVGASEVVDTIARSCVEAFSPRWL